MREERLDNPMHSQRIDDPRDYEQEYCQELEDADQEMERQRDDALFDDVE
jgi:hypothetical protein